MKKSVSGSQSSPCLTQPLSSRLLLPAVPKPMLSSRFQVNPPKYPQYQCCILDTDTKIQHRQKKISTKHPREFKNLTR